MNIGKSPGPGSATATEQKEPWESGGWDLGDLLPDSEEATVEAAVQDVECEVEAFESRRADLDTMDSEALSDMVAAYERIASGMQRVAAYGALWFSSDTQSEQALALRSRVEQRMTQLQNRLLFFSLWWKGLDEKRVSELTAGVKGHEDQIFFLEELRRFRPYTLDEPREQLVNLKDADGVRGLLTVYSMLTNRLVFELEVDGEKCELNRDELVGHVMSTDGDVRERAYREFFRVFSNEAKILGQIYVHRVRDWHNENVSLRSYPSPIAVRNAANDIPDEAVDRLLEASQANAPLFRRFFELKAGWLGQERLRRYDLYAPLSPSNRKVDYAQAVSSVLDTFAEFDPRVADAARRVFEDGHIDSEIRVGKRSGAFCATVLPEMTPWVLVNFAGRVRDVATLAHELGHAVHSILAEDHSILTQHASLPLAETASVFAEMLMTDRLLENESDPAVRRELLATAVDDIYATVLRQSYFVLFEKEAHAAILDGRSLDELNDIYFKTLEDQFGSSVELSPEFRHEWVAIPHIFSTPFYCYAYSFGQLLVLSLYNRFRQDPEGFKPGYLQLLAHGGSERPATILGEAGIDMTDATFWQGGFDLVGDLIDQLEALEGAAG